MAKLRHLSAGGTVYIQCAAPLSESVQAACRLAQPHISIKMCDSIIKSFIPEWESQKGKYDPSRRLPGPAEDASFQCLITDTVASADTAYALYSKQVPVLVLSTDSEVAASMYGANPLLTATSGCVGSAVKEMLSFPEQPGRVFVVEGGDGAGKQTQVGLLVDRLTTEGFPAATLDYPHDRADLGVLIREVLGGQRGDLKAVSPLIFGALYGLNRRATLPVLNHWVRKGYNVVLDRYMSANFGHQASKFATDEEREAAIKSLEAFELQWLDLPAAHRVVYLNLPPVVAFRAMQADTTRRALDEHEKAGINYKNNVRDAFVWCTHHLKGWYEVRCCEDRGDDSNKQDADDEIEFTRLSREDVHHAIYKLLEAEFVNKTE